MIVSYEFESLHYPVNIIQLDNGNRDLLLQKWGKTVCCYRLLLCRIHISNPVRLSLGWMMITLQSSRKSLDSYVCNDSNCLKQKHVGRKGKGVLKKTNREKGELKIRIVGFFGPYHHGLIRDEKPIIISLLNIRRTAGFCRTRPFWIRTPKKEPSVLHGKL